MLRILNVIYRYVPGFEIKGGQKVVNMLHYNTITSTFISDKETLTEVKDLKSLDHSATT